MEIPFAELLGDVVLAWAKNLAVVVWDTGSGKFECDNEAGRRIACAQCIKEVG